MVRYNKVMMTDYISQNLHQYGRVQTGWASRFNSDRFLNSNQLVCPPPMYVDLQGRPADHYSIRTTSAGCNSSLERVDVENAQRPSSFTFATLSDIGMNGGYSCDELKKANEALAYSLMAAGGGQITDTRGFYSQQMRDKQWNDIGRKVVYYKVLSGMTM